MNPKHDRTRSRTPTETEQKFNLDDIKRIAKDLSVFSTALNALQNLITKNTESIGQLFQTKAEKSGWIPDKFLGTNENGSIVEKDKPTYTASDITTEDGETVEEKLSSVLSNVYPVGSVYISVNTTEPSTLFGGVWELFAQGRILLGVEPEEASEDLITIFQPTISCYIWKRTS